MSRVNAKNRRPFGPLIASLLAALAAIAPGRALAEPAAGPVPDPRPDGTSGSRGIVAG